GRLRRRPGVALVGLGVGVDRGEPLLGPGGERLVRALARDFVVELRGLRPLALLLVVEAGAGQGAVAHGRLQRGGLGGGLEGRDRGGVALLLELALPQQHECLAALAPSGTNAAPRPASSGLRDAAFARVAASLKLFLAKALWAISSETRPLSGWSGKSFRRRAHAVSASRGRPGFPATSPAS